ncbi:type VI secretion system baseplate subunit TssK [Chitinophaga jiangningensis]|nr:type VI secretion system baseplate subunit TssK [Chitinophaga jiangningensis]
MDTPVYYPFLNWQDGMKVNSQHFTDLENALISINQQLFRSTVGHCRYGLLYEPGKAPGLKMTITPVAGNAYCILLNDCYAVTPGGAYIRIPIQVREESLRPLLEYTIELPAKGNQQYLFLQVHSYQRLPAGHTNTDVLPFKTYYTVEEMQLTLTPQLHDEAGISTWWQLPLARLIHQQGYWIPDPTYIPPCMNLGAHTQLLEMAISTHAQLGYIHTYCKLIIQKVYARQQSQELATALLYIAEHLSAMLLHQTCWHGGVLPYIHPYDWYCYLYKIAACWCTALEQRAGHMKEELMLYLSEWGDFSPGEMDQIFAAALIAVYKHQDMMAALQPLYVFVDLLHRVTHAISQLDFIGKRPDTNIFVKEEKAVNPVYQKQTKKSRWSFSE